MLPSEGKLQPAPHLVGPDRYDAAVPLTAELDGDRVQSSEYSPQHWDLLKGSYRARYLQLSCGIPAIPKTSRLGL